jgi:hypothetical protein
VISGLRSTDIHAIEEPRQVCPAKGKPASGSGGAVMPMPCPTGQISFYDPEHACPEAIEAGSLTWLFVHHRRMVVPAWLAEGWDNRGQRGRDRWPAAVLLVIVLLRWSESGGMSRRLAIRRARTDLSWRAAMGLSLRDRTPSRRALGRFERWLQRRDPRTGIHRYLLLFEHVVRQCGDQGVVGAEAVWAMDSTPMWCYGAVLDTVRMLGDGMVKLGRGWSEASDSSMAAVAYQWELPLLLSKSTKGWLNIDWHDADARAVALEGLAREVERVVVWVRQHIEEVRSNKRKRLLRLCRNLLRVVEQNLEADEQGRLVVARKVVQGRLVSLTDPEARHGRKSRSRVFNGYKLSVLGDVVSGLIAAVTVAPGNTHDGRVAPRIIQRAKRLREEIELVLADTAYGDARLRFVSEQGLGVKLLAPPPAASRARTPVSKAHFTVDFDGGTVTCPAGQVTSDFDLRRAISHDVLVRAYRWPKEVCGACVLRDACRKGSRGGKRLRLHPYERWLVRARKDWADPEIREQYRVRTQCERLVDRLTRHGARQADAWGLGSANFQAHCVGITCNLELLAKKLAARERESRAA